MPGWKNGYENPHRKPVHVCRRQPIARLHHIISLGSSLPFLLVLLGVLGMVVFGLIGVFIGPTLLAVGYSLAHKWASRELDSVES